MGEMGMKGQASPGHHPRLGAGGPPPGLEPGTEGCSPVQKGRRCWWGESLGGEGQPGCGGGPQGGGPGNEGSGEAATAGQGGVKASTAPGAGGGQAGSR